MINLITVLGHTAAGKTGFAAHLAHQVGGEIISADSRQVYRRMDIGTGKDLKDYQVGDSRVPVHLIDILDAGNEYNVYQYKQDFLQVYRSITQRGIMPLLCGGSGLYIESVLRNYKLLNVPLNAELREDLENKGREELTEILKLYGALHNRTDTSHRKRLIRAIEIAKYQYAHPDDSADEKNLDPLVLGIRYERNLRRERITRRLMERLGEGMVEEVDELMRSGVKAEKLDYYGLEYRFICRYLIGELPYDEMVSKLNTAIQQFAKRQMTYFRGMERRGIEIHWLEGSLSMEKKTETAMALLSGT